MFEEQCIAAALVSTKGAAWAVGVASLFSDSELPEELSSTDVLHDKVDAGCILKRSKHADEPWMVDYPQHIPLCLQVDDLHH